MKMLDAVGCHHALPGRLLAQTLGSGLIIKIVVGGSGIAAQRLFPSTGRQSFEKR